MVRLASLILCFLATAASADTPLRSLDRGDEARNWVAVGRVNIGQDGFCTGTLIEPSIVMTAAHCFFDPNTGKRIANSRVRFVAGWSGGSADSIRGARRVFVDPEYQYSMHPTNVQISHDLALIELDQPIRDNVVRPFARSTRPRTGAQVGIVSYAEGRSEFPSIQDSCTVLGQHDRIMALSCDVTFGASGSPIFDMSGPHPSVVSVVSAKGELAGRTAAFTVAIDGKIEDFMDQMRASSPQRKTAQIGAMLNEQLGRRTNLRHRLPQIPSN